MKKVVFITHLDAGYGFSLGGIPQHAVAASDLEETLKQVMAGPDNGLLVVDERLINNLSEERLRELENGWHGMILIMPSPVKPPAEAEDFAARLIRRAIGYHVKLQL